MSIELRNGVLLPDLPTEITECPYYIITRGANRSGYQKYYAKGLQTEALVVSAQLSGTTDSYICVQDDSYKSSEIAILPDSPTALTDAKWLDVQVMGSQNDKSSSPVEDLNIFTSTYGLMLNNHDVYYASACDVVTDSYGLVTIRSVTPGTEIYLTANISNSHEPQKFLGVSGLERLIANTRSLIDAVLPSGGTAGQVLTIGADGNPVWADATGSASLPAAEELMFG